WFCFASTLAWPCAFASSAIRSRNLIIASLISTCCLCTTSYGVDPASSTNASENELGAIDVKADGDERILVRSDGKYEDFVSLVAFFFGSAPRVFFSSSIGFSSQIIA